VKSPNSTKIALIAVVMLACAAVLGFMTCGGGGSNIINPTPTLDSIAVTAASPSLMVGGTDQMTAMGTYSDGSTQNLTNSATTTWSSTNAKVATITASGIATGVAAGTATFTATSGTVTGTSAMVTVSQPATITSVTVSCNSTTISGGATTQCAATVAGTGDFDPTVTWKSSNTAVATVASIGKDTAEVTGLTATSTAQVTIAATSKQDSTKSGTATITVLRTITIAVTPSELPWNQIYSEYGFILGYSLTCSGCMTGDALYTLEIAGQESVVTTLTQPTTTIPMLTNIDANFNVPGPIKFWFVGADGVRSNTLWLLYRGSQNVAVQSAATGEIYYYYSGDSERSAQGFFASVLLFKSDGTGDGSIPCIPMANSIAVDDVNNYLLVAGVDGPGVYVYDLGNLDIVGGVPIPVNGIALGSANTGTFAVFTSGGVFCTTQPEAGTTSCMKDSPNTQKPQPPVITITDLNDPMALVMPDASHVVVYCTGDQTLHWYTLDVVAGTATPLGTLTLQGFTNTDASFWSNHVGVGGWFIVQVGSTLGVMGQVVNTDGTVDQELALVDNPSQKQVGANYRLPDGTVLITPDPANNAIAIQYPQYPDTTSDAPVTNFARLYVDTGNMVDLASISALTPSVAFLVLQNSEIFTGVLGQIALEPNQ